MKKIALFFGVALLMLASCASSSESVKYTVAKNYFVKNNAKVPEGMKITTQQAFDDCFGMATTMGSDGKPTEIDFSKSFVITKILPQTNNDTEVSPAGLQKKGSDVLLLKSDIKKGETMSYSIRPFYIIVVSNEYAGYKVEEVK